MIPGFPLSVELMENSIACGSPAALSENRDSRSKILFLTPEAAKEGIGLNMTIAQAKAICPDLTVLTRDSQKEDRKIAEIIERLYSIGPVIEKSDPGTFYMDLTGLRRLHHDEENIASRIIERVGESDFAVKVGVAGTKFTAFVAAETCHLSDYKIVAAGKEKDFLAARPVHLLQVDRDLLETLSLLGVKTVGEFAKLPPKDVTERYGKAGLRLLKMAKGEDDEPVAPFLPKQEESDGVDPDFPLDTEAYVLFYSKTILEKLLNKISKKSLVCEEISVELSLEDNSKVGLRLPTVERTNDAGIFLDILKLKLGKLRLSAPVKELFFCVKRASEISARQLSFHYRGDLSSLTSLLAQATKIVGIKRISNLEALKGNPSVNRISKRTTLGLRLFSPPKCIDVTADDGLISSVSVDSGFQKVIKQDGPWKIDGKWWDKSFERKYYEVELNKGNKYLVFHDLKSTGWFLQGIFD